MGNCPTRAYVDFGDGPVKIRCTQTGQHAQCRCEIFIFDEGVAVPEGAVVKHNVFDNPGG